jgi:hypothetical protein
MSLSTGRFVLLRVPLYREVCLAVATLSTGRFVLLHVPLYCLATCPSLQGGLSCCVSLSTGRFVLLRGLCAGLPAIFTALPEQGWTVLTQGHGVHGHEIVIVHYRDCQIPSSTSLISPIACMPTPANMLPKDPWQGYGFES